MGFSKILLSGLLAAGALSSLGKCNSPTAGVKPMTPGCTDIIVPVTISGLNMFLPVDSNIGPVFNLSFSGTYNIGATYCAPTKDVHSRRDTLQVLVHGITYDRAYFAGHNSPANSWTAYATSQGYPTLTIDRLCNGLSDHPDGNTVCQVNSHVEVIHQLVSKARAGTLPGAAAIKFNKIIYAGHSFGSVIGNVYNIKYPNEADATILTGFGAQTNIAYLLATLFPPLRPASTVDPKFSSLDASYLEMTNITAQRTIFFSGPTNTYNESLFQLDYSIRGTLTNGEAQSGAVQAGLLLAVNYQNPVFVITGRRDATFCGPLNVDGTFDCGTNANSSLAQVAKLYPAVASRNFGFYSPQNSAHCWHLMNEAYATFGVAHDWLNDRGF